MFSIGNLIKNWSESRKKRNDEERKRIAEDDALHSFNISEHEGMPVIIYNKVIISVPESKVTGDQLIKTMLKLREIFVKSKTK